MAVTIGIILLATIARFAVGALWYMPKGLFGKKWLALQGETAIEMTPEKKKEGNKSMATGFIFTLISTFILGLMLNPLAKMSSVSDLPIVLPVIFLAFIIWLGFVVPILAQRKIYDLKKVYSWPLFWIDATHELAGLIVAGLILASLL